MSRHEDMLAELRPWLDEAEGLLGDRDALFGLALAVDSLRADPPNELLAQRSLKLWIDGEVRRGRTYAEEQERGYTRGLRGSALEQVALLYSEARAAARRVLETL